MLFWNFIGLLIILDYTLPLQTSQYLYGILKLKKGYKNWNFFRIKKFKGHEQVVNTCNPARRGPDLLVSGSDDHTTKIWDLRVKGRVCEFEVKHNVIQGQIPSDCGFIQWYYRQNNYWRNR
jgi:WD40 repeat protein